MTPLGQPPRGGSPRSIFESSVHGLATTAAVAAAFFATPVIHTQTLPMILRFTEEHYGYGLNDLVAVAWFVIVALLSFFFARASLSTLLVMGGLALAARMF